jgi:hypothetical protein
MPFIMWFHLITLTLIHRYIQKYPEFSVILEAISNNCLKIGGHHICSSKGVLERSKTIFG